MLEIGSEKAKILLDIYRPVLLKSSHRNDQVPMQRKEVISYHGIIDDIRIPLINCEQFSIRDFSEYGVKEYQVKSGEAPFYITSPLSISQVSQTLIILQSIRQEAYKGYSS